MKSTEILLAATALLLSAVAGPTSAAPKIPAYVTAAIADPGRPAADTRRDPYYDPAATIAFAGVKPGAKVVDFMAGDGYYTRIFSKIVGPKGYVYAYYNTEEDTPAVKSGKTQDGATLAAFPNVGVEHGPVLKFAAPEPVDIVWTALTYHDLFHSNFPNLDLNAVNRAVYTTLKPGGLYIVIDRSSRAGAGLGDLDSLLRIDEATVKSQIEAAGFKLVAESNVLRNPSDDLTKKVGKADQDKGAKPDMFVLKFQKPRR